MANDPHPKLPVSTPSEQRRIARELIYDAAREDFHTFYRLVFAVVEPNTPFMEAEVHKGLAYAGYEFVEGITPRLLLAVPPRHGKSVIFSVFLVAWELGRDPATKVLCASYGKVLSEHFHFLCRQLMQSELYAAIFPKTILASSTQISLWTTVGGCRFAGSVEGGVTGFGFHMMIVDDPMKAQDASSPAMRLSVMKFIKGTLMTRFENNKPQRIAIVMQRLHQDDPIGQMKEDTGWTYLHWPARATRSYLFPTSHWDERSFEPGDLLFPEAFDEARLAQLEADLGSATFNAQYLQKPESPDGIIVKRKYFKIYEELPPAWKIEAYYQSWDVAITTGEYSAYSVCITFAISGQNIYIVDVFRAKLDLAKLEFHIPRLKAEWDVKTVNIELNGIGAAVYQTIRKQPGASEWLWGVSAINDKETRLHLQLPKLIRKRVWLPVEADWRDAFLEEVLSAPLAKYWDQVDALTQFLFILDQKHYTFSELSAYELDPALPF